MTLRSRPDDVRIRAPQRRCAEVVSVCPTWDALASFVVSRCYSSCTNETKLLGLRPLLRSSSKIYVFTTITVTFRI
uniref:Uncharacterized protein n=1 Tax=Pararge aegeria TaxID=116150 RepID=S4P911_9NEOP